MGLRYLKLIHELLLPSRSQDWVGILVIKNVVVMCCSRDWIPRDNCGLNPWPGQNLMPGTTVSTQDMMGQRMEEGDCRVTRPCKKCSSLSLSHFHVHRHYVLYHEQRNKQKQKSRFSSNFTLLCNLHLLVQLIYPLTALISLNYTLYCQIKRLSLKYLLKADLGESPVTKEKNGDMVYTIYAGTYKLSLLQLC